MSTAAPETLPSSLAPLFTRTADSIPLLPSKPHSPTLKSEITSLSSSKNYSDALTASLHLLNDDVSAAHDIVTDREDDEGCCVVHAILHRREGEYWNSKYWFSRITHPFIDEFYGGRAGAKEFVDQVEAVVRGKKTASSSCGAKNLLGALKGRQEEELKSLVVFFWRQDGGK